MTNGKSRSKSEGILRGLTESILEASDQEILEDAQAVGIDLDEAASRLRTLANQIILQHRKEARRKAQEDWQSRSLEDHDLDAALPETAEERRSLFERVQEFFRGQPEMRFTLQFRDFRELSDEDICAHLRMLVALGVSLDDLESMEKDGRES